MKDDEIRKAFEWWASDEGEWPKAVERSRDGAYKLMSTDANWRVWQAATRAAVPAWQPIETAPKDGTVVLARIPDHDVQQAVMWSAKEQCWVIQWDHWKLDGFDTPTHWMHLPEVE